MPGEDPVVETYLPSPSSAGAAVNVTEPIVIAASPDAVWEVAGDAGAIADWVPAIESSRLDGDVRHATFAGGGGDARERIVEHDAAARAHSYEYPPGPLPPAGYASPPAVPGPNAGAGGVLASAVA